MNDRCDNWAWFSTDRTPVWPHIAIFAVSAFTAWVAFFFFDPASRSLLPPCLFHLLTGLHCPGCGATRALHRLAHGDFNAALKLNALVVLGLPLIFAVAIWRKRLKTPSWFWKTLIVCIVMFAVTRNIPLYPFNLLAP